MATLEEIKQTDLYATLIGIEGYKEAVTDLVGRLYNKYEMGINTGNNGKTDFYVSETVYLDYNDNGFSDSTMARMAEDLSNISYYNMTRYLEGKASIDDIVKEKVNEVGAYIREDYYDYESETSSELRRIIIEVAEDHGLDADDFYDTLEYYEVTDVSLDLSAQIKQALNKYVEVGVVLQTRNEANRDMGALQGVFLGDGRIPLLTQLLSRDLDQEEREAVFAELIEEIKEDIEADNLDCYDNSVVKFLNAQGITLSTLKSCEEVENYSDKLYQLEREIQHDMGHQCTALMTSTAIQFEYLIELKVRKALLEFTKDPNAENNCIKVDGPAGFISPFMQSASIMDMDTYKPMVAHLSEVNFVVERSSNDNPYPCTLYDINGGVEDKGGIELVTESVIGNNLKQFMLPEFEKPEYEGTGLKEAVEALEKNNLAIYDRDVERNVFYENRKHQEEQRKMEQARAQLQSQTMKM